MGRAAQKSSMANVAAASAAIAVWAPITVLVWRAAQAAKGVGRTAVPIPRICATAPTTAAIPRCVGQTAVPISPMYATAPATAACQAKPVWEPAAQMRRIPALERPVAPWPTRFAARTAAQPGTTAIQAA